MDLYLYIERLRDRTKFKDVEAAILAYLRHRSKNAQPWMYEALAIAIEFNKGAAGRVKDALGYAALLAERGGNPNFMLSVADKLYLRGYFDYAIAVGGKQVRIAVGPLLDRVSDKVPHRAEPLLMSMNLARKTLDPRRMADALERASSLGWPGMDDVMRADLRRRVEELADVLKEEGREPEADELLARLPSALGRDLFARLTWDGDADLDLIVDEPLGATASHFAPRTVFGGAIVKDGKAKNREETYVCPRAFDGDYTFRVEVVYQDPDKPPITSARLEIISQDGLPGEHKEVRRIALPKPTPVVVHDKDGKVETLSSPAPLRSAPVIVHLTGGRRKAALPYMAPSTLPTSILVVPVPDRDLVPASPGRSPAPPGPGHTPTAPKPTPRAMIRP